MAEQEEHGRFLQNVGESFTHWLAGVSAIISTQGVSQVVGSFDWGTYQI